ncbi:nucleotidyltransferase domain-containing protein [Niabella insulamsoli]|uniref:nucleotidyltransferase domain-containing protein n=1 Tax=Niabella insulamsoli TaxID=3144874 RepID=UPI0031FC6318
MKQIVSKHDPNATLILFGSRARGDWQEDSDWDFLILTDKEELKDLHEDIRNDVLEQIEWKTFEVVQTIVRNKKDWQEKYRITDLYDSIQQEGKIV